MPAGSEGGNFLTLRWLELASREVPGNPSEKEAACTF